MSSKDPIIKSSLLYKLITSNESYFSNGKSYVKSGLSDHNNELYAPAVKLYNEWHYAQLALFVKSKPSLTADNKTNAVIKATVESVDKDKSSVLKNMKASDLQRLFNNAEYREHLRKLNTNDFRSHWNRRYVEESKVTKAAEVKAAKVAKAAEVKAAEVKATEVKTSEAKVSKVSKASKSAEAKTESTEKSTKPKNAKKSSNKDDLDNVNLDFSPLKYDELAKNEVQLQKEFNKWFDSNRLMDSSENVPVYFVMKLMPNFKIVLKNYLSVVFTRVTAKFAKILDGKTSYSKDLLTKLTKYDDSHNTEYGTALKSQVIKVLKHSDASYDNEESKSEVNSLGGRVATLLMHLVDQLAGLTQLASNNPSFKAFDSVHFGVGLSAVLHNVGISHVDAAALTSMNTVVATVADDNASGDNDDDETLM